MSGWSIQPTSVLRAHFKQPQGPSKPGADWVVSLSSEGKTANVLVRVYAEDIKGQSPEQEAETVVKYVGSLIQSGWTPAAYRGAPGELTYTKPPQVVVNAGPTPSSSGKKPWWRFW